jgi:hypothetical protein
MLNSLSRVPRIAGVAHEVTCFALGTYVDDDGTLSLTERG